MSKIRGNKGRFRISPRIREGVKIMSKGGAAQPVKIISKEDGAPPANPIETRIVGQTEFEKTKKLVEDEHMG